MLPAIFRRRSRYSSNGRSRNRHSSKKWWSLLLLCLFAGITGYWLWYLHYPMDEQQQRLSDTSVTARTTYVITSDTTDIMCFTASRGDTLLMGIGGTTTDIIHAEYTVRYPALPYSAGTLAVLPYDTASITRMSHDAIHSILLNEAEYIEEVIATAKAQRSDVDYYLKTHTVTDNGFDIVARYSKELTAATDSLLLVQKKVAAALQKKNLSIHLSRRYYQHTAEGTIECHPITMRDSILLLSGAAWSATSMARDTTVSMPLIQRALSQHVAFSRLQHHLALYRQHHPVYTTAIDSLGTYTGQRDSLNLPHGVGTFQSLHGDFYEGDWEHGKRTGLGFSMSPGKRLCMGEWKDDKFLGERMAYTQQRIYGIDISRYQHEKQVVVKRGRRKRTVTQHFAINWKNLRITSLGHQSKKTIHGEVDYPVRFIYIKATEGVTVKNKYFASDYDNSRKHGYRTGAYHFYSVRTPGGNQAVNFLRNSRYAKGDLPPVLDLEPTDAQIRQAGGINRLFQGVRVWLNTVERQRGVRPILYISQRFVNKYLPLAPDLMKNYDVWIARYGEYKPNVNLVYWQLCQDGRVAGIQTPVDINVFNGFTFK